MRTVYIGSFTPEGRGISRFAQDEATGALSAIDADPVAVELESPSYLAWHSDGRHLYACNEGAGGRVTALAVHPTGIQVLNDQPSGGEDPCHVAVDPSGRYLATANYRSGSVAVHPINGDGTLGERSALVEHTGSGPDPERQEGPHAHQVCFITAPADDHAPPQTVLLAVDLGSDAVLSYRLDHERGGLEPLGSSDMRPGSGARHLVLASPQMAYIAAELSSTVIIGRLDPASGEVAVTAEVPTTTHDGESYPSGIRLSADERFVYVANRGPDTIGVLALDGGGADLIHEVPTGGAWPRDIQIVEGFLYAANQHSDTVTVFWLDPDSGIPVPTGAGVDVPSPACVLSTHSPELRLKD